MATELSKGTLFDPQLVTDLINKVKGKSSLAKLGTQQPIPFNGMKEFTFTMDSEIDIVAENGKKTHGGVSLAPVTIVPIKFEYGARVSDEFMYASEEAKVDILKAFNEGFAAKVAKGLDIAAFHGFNPRTGSASSVVGNNHFDSKVTQTVTYVAASIDDNIESAIALVEGSDGEVSGMALSPTARQALAALKNSANERLYPELAWGGQPGTINGLAVDVNKTVSNGDVDEAIVGDFANMFKWGYAKEIPMKVIEYGDPDNSGKDLQGYNQVYIRAEIYLGWGILDASSFARIINAA
nr:MAG TPA: major capsid protein [Caudoviricetes sp.]